VSAGSDGDAIKSGFCTSCYLSRPDVPFFSANSRTAWRARAWTSDKTARSVLDETAGADRPEVYSGHYDTTRSVITINASR
jgi:hypothetical protein